MHLSDTDPCPCGSNKPAGVCCIRTKRVYERDGSCVFRREVDVAQADPRPDKPQTGTRVEGCYAACLDDCEGVLTDEHFVSHRMLKMLSGGKPLKVRGIDPKDQQAERSVIPKKITARVLCERHNRALKPIDTAGNRFFETVFFLNKWLDEEPPGAQHIVAINGHDVERWCLKTLCGFLARAGKVVPELWTRILFGQCDVIRPRGLYAYAEVGDVHTGATIGVEEIREKGGDSVGVIVHLLNHELVFSAWAGNPVGLEAHHDGKWRIFRPRGFTFKNSVNGSEAFLWLSWQDSVFHATIESEWNRSLPL